MATGAVVLVGGLWAAPAGSDGDRAPEMTAARAERDPDETTSVQAATPVEDPLNLDTVLTLTATVREQREAAEATWAAAVAAEEARKAEEARRAEEARKAEEARRAEELRRKAEAEAEAAEQTSQAAGAPAPSPAPAPAVAGGSVWDQLAQCEAGGNWHINTGNGYYGGLQFSASSWRAVGGAGLPHQHSREVQIQMGERLQARQGWGAWPHCSRKLGLR